MGLADAKADGVRMDTRRDRLFYYPRCFFCLHEIEAKHYMSKRRYVCPECKPLIKTFRDYYADKESRTLFEAIHREAQSKLEKPHGGSESSM